jgi:hypothetical protein
VGAASALHTSGGGGGGSGGGGGGEDARLVRLHAQMSRQDHKAVIMKRVKMGKTTIEEGLRLIVC